MQSFDRQIDLDATEELPVLDVAAYEAQLHSAEPAALPDSEAREPVVAGRDPDELLNVEQWIAHKTTELRSLQEALARARRDHSEAETRAEQVSRNLTEAAVTIRSLEECARGLTATLDGQQTTARRAEEIHAAAQLQVDRLRAELSALSEADAEHRAALVEAQSLLADRSATLAALERDHDNVVAERGRLLIAVARLEARIAEDEARQDEARTAVDAKTRAHAELVTRLAGQERTLAQLTDELTGNKAQLARCLEQLQTRECYRSIYETNLHELDVELDAAEARMAVLAPHAKELEARVAELSAQVAAHCATIAELESSAVGQAKLLADRETSLADAEQQLAARRVALEARGRDLDAALAEIERLRGAHAQALESIASARAEYERARIEGEAHAAATAQERDAALARLECLETSLAAAAGEAEAQRGAIAGALERTRELELRLADREAQAAAAAAELGQSRASLSELSATAASQQALLAEHGRLLAESQATAQRYMVDRDTQAQLIAALREEISLLNGRLAAPESERRALEERATALALELERSEARAARVERMNTELRATSQLLTRSLAEREAELHQVTRIASTRAYALDRVQSSIDSLGSLSAAACAEGDVSEVGMLTRIDGEQHQSIVLRGRTTIGRDADNDVPLKARFVSRRHAAVIPTPGSALVEDLRSTNGVIVNGRRVRCARLAHGDVITLGTANFRYTVGSAADGPVPGGSNLSAVRHIQ